MSVRVVARIRPLLKAESERDVIVNSGQSSTSATSTLLTIPNPKNASENFTFNFNSVYDRETTQQDLFDNEVSPNIKHLFAGFDVTIFAYGVTGTGKTHTMRGGKSLADRGVIPRLLSSIYRKGRKLEKDSNGTTTVDVRLSYYEIYCDKVYDLFEPPEKRTLAGLPIRDNNGKTVISGLTERPCTTLKEFEQLYDEANINRSTSATKLNAHSSRSHAILQVKVSQITSSHTTTSTVSAIDLAGSEDNRRTENNKDRMVESSSINKSLFVLAQCVEAIGKKQNLGATNGPHIRVPYRESKMTRILSLGQNNGLTVMILNLAPVRSYHLDTLSSLNFANRTKKIEIREVENEPIIAGKLLGKESQSVPAPRTNRQPLRPLPSAVNIGLKPATTSQTKPGKEFLVFTDRKSLEAGRPSPNRLTLKRGLDASQNSNQSNRPTKSIRPNFESRFANVFNSTLSRSHIEDLVNRMVDEKLAKQALASTTTKEQEPALSDDIQRRLAALEQRVEQKEEEEGGRAEGLQYLLMAKQHTVRGEDSSALKMYKLAVPFFPDNKKLERKMMALEEKIRLRREENVAASAPVATATMAKSEDFSRRPQTLTNMSLSRPAKTVSKVSEMDDGGSDDEYRDDAGQISHDDDDDYASDANVHRKPTTKTRKPKSSKMKIFTESAWNANSQDESMTPRSSNLIRIINTRDLSQIRLLRGVGLKKAEAIVNSLCENDGEEDAILVTSLQQLGGLRGVGVKTVENMRSGIVV